MISAAKLYSHNNFKGDLVIFTRYTGVCKKIFTFSLISGLCIASFSDVYAVKDESKSTNPPRYRATRPDLSISETRLLRVHRSAAEQQALERAEYKRISEMTRRAYDAGIAIEAMHKAAEAAYMTIDLERSPESVRRAVESAYLAASERARSALDSVDTLAVYKSELGRHLEAKE